MATLSGVSMYVELHFERERERETESGRGRERGVKSVRGVRDVRDVRGVWGVRGVRGVKRRLFWESSQALKRVLTKKPCTASKAGTMYF